MARPPRYRAAALAIGHPGPDASRSSPPLKRLETWLWTGPVGHFAGGALDFAGALARYLLARQPHSDLGANDSLGGLLSATGLPNDSDTPRGVTSTGQVAISIRCAAEELIETRPGVGVLARVDHQQVRLLVGDRHDLRAERPGQGLGGRLRAAVAAGLADRDDPLHV